MSHTYKRELNQLSEHARESGMAEPELAHWRARLDPVALDLCGCKTGALATLAVGTGAFGTVLLTSLGGWLWAVISTLLTAVIAKIVGQLVAERRRTRLVQLLNGRIQQLLQGVSTVQ